MHDPLGGAILAPMKPALALMTLLALTAASPGEELGQLLFSG